MPKSIEDLIKDKHPGENITRLLAQKLAKNKGSIPKTADELGLSRSGLWKYLNYQKV